MEPLISSNIPNANVVYYMACKNELMDAIELIAKRYTESKIINQPIENSIKKIEADFKNRKNYLTIIGYDHNNGNKPVSTLTIFLSNYPSREYDYGKPFNTFYTHIKNKYNGNSLNFAEVGRFAVDKDKKNQYKFSIDIICAVPKLASLLDIEIIFMSSNLKHARRYSKFTFFKQVNGTTTYPKELNYKDCIISYAFVNEILKEFDNDDLLLPMRRRFNDHLQFQVLVNKEELKTKFFKYL